MIRSIILFHVLAAQLAFSQEREFTVTSGPFKVSETLTGVLIPTKTQVVNLALETDTKLELLRSPRHGQAISAGEPILTFKTEPLDQKIINQKAKLETKELELAIANRDLAALKLQNELELAKAKQSLDQAETNLAYFTETELPARKDELKHREKQKELYLLYTKEELNQLQKMYEDDDLTEETEEIILVRQKNAVTDAAFQLSKTKRENEKILTQDLPREESKLKNAVTAAQITYATANANLSRQYELKKLEIDARKRELENARQQLAKLQSDRERLEVTANFDGIIYFGEFTEGKWEKGESRKHLKAGSTVPAHTNLLTLVANDSPVTLVSLQPSEKAAKFSDFTQTENSPILSISPRPNLANNHLITLKERTLEPFEFPGQTAQQEIILYQNPSTLSIPKLAVKTKEDGTTTVLVKLTEGQPEERPIEIGQTNGEAVEVLSGLEEGQVVLH